MLWISAYSPDKVKGTRFLSSCQKLAATNGQNIWSNRFKDTNITNRDPGGWKTRMRWTFWHGSLLWKASRCWGRKGADAEYRSSESRRLCQNQGGQYSWLMGQSIDETEHINAGKRIVKMYRVQPNCGRLLVLTFTWRLVKMTKAWPNRQEDMPLHCLFPLTKPENP